MLHDLPSAACHLFKQSHRSVVRLRPRCFGMRVVQSDTPTFPDERRPVIPIPANAIVAVVAIYE
jgi:hypothetical protein